MLVEIINFLPGIVIALIVIAFILLLVKVTPEVSIDEKYIYIRKYVIPQKLRLDKIAKIRMMTHSAWSGDGIFYITLKLILHDGQQLILNTPQKQEFGFRLNFKDLTKNYDDTSFLPSSDLLKKIAAHHPNIEFDQFTKSYIDTGKTDEYVTVING